jgi:hypothetical protein
MEYSITEPRGPIVGVCAVCRAAVRERAAWRCQKCVGLLHLECSAILGGCATYACPEAGSIQLRRIKYLRACAERHGHQRVFELLVCGLTAILAAVTGNAAVGLVVLLAAGVDAVRAKFAFAAAFTVEDSQRAASVPDEKSVH